MFDELERLASCAELSRLLEHYGRLASADREVWQDRCMALESVEPKPLSRLHGELIAFGWIEQNTGHSVAGASGGVARCYRVTSAGLRALRQAPCARQSDDEQGADQGNGTPLAPSLDAEPADQGHRDELLRQRVA